MVVYCLRSPLKSMSRYISTLIVFSYNDSPRCKYLSVYWLLLMQMDTLTCYSIALTPVDYFCFLKSRTSTLAKRSAESDLHEGASQVVVFFFFFLLILRNTVSRPAIDMQADARRSNHPIEYWPDSNYPDSRMLPILRDDALCLRTFNIYWDAGETCELFFPFLSLLSSPVVQDNREHKKVLCKWKGKRIPASSGSHRHFPFCVPHSSWIRFISILLFYFLLSKICGVGSRCNGYKKSSDNFNRCLFILPFLNLSFDHPSLRLGCVNVLVNPFSRSLRLYTNI